MKIFLYNHENTLSKIKSDEIDIQKVYLILFEKPLSFISCNDLYALINKIFFMINDITHSCHHQIAISNISKIHLS